MQKIVKEAPPPTHTGREFTDWLEVVRIAKDQPHEWVKVGPYSPGIPNHLRKGVYRQFYDPESKVPAEVQIRQAWEITSRTVNREPHQVMVYIKYLGG
jgi:hypothetical protein